MKLTHALFLAAVAIVVGAAAGYLVGKGRPTRSAPSEGVTSVPPGGYDRIIITTPTGEHRFRATAPADHETGTPRPDGSWVVFLRSSRGGETHWDTYWAVPGE